MAGAHGSDAELQLYVSTAARSSLLSRADARLYDAKRGGRNRVVIER